MKSLIKRSKLFRWLMPAGTSPATTGGAVQPERGPAGRRDVDVFPRLYPSQLEPRIVLNASPVVQLDPSGELAIDAGEFADDGIADTFDVQLVGEDAETVNVSVNGTVVYTGSIADVQNIQINGSGDADQLSLDAAVLDRVSVSFDPGGATASHDSVELTAGIEGTWQAVSVDLSSAGGNVQLTRNDGVLSAALSFTGTVDIVDSLAVADRALALGDVTSVIVTGQDGGLEVQSAMGTLLFMHGDQAAWEIDANGGTLRLEGTIDLLSLSARAEQITVNGSVTASAGTLKFEASDQFQLAAPAQLTTSEHSVTIEADQITLAGTIEARDGGDVFATAGEDGTIRLSGLIVVSDHPESTDDGSGEILLQGDVLLIGDSELGVETGDLTITGAVDGAFALTILATTGTIDLQGAVGSTTALAALTVTSAGTVHFTDSVITTGAQQLTAATLFAAALHRTQNAPLTISGNLLLAGDTVIDTGGGDFQVGGWLNSTGNGTAISDGHSLTVTAGTGAARFLGTIGGAADGALGDLQVTARSIALANIGTVSSAGVAGTTQFLSPAGITLTGTIMRTAGSQRYEGPVTIDSAGDLLIRTTGGGAHDQIVFSGDVEHVPGWNSHLTVRTAGDSEIEFAGAIDLAGDLLLDAGGDLTVGGTLSGGGTVTLLGANIHLLADVHSAGAVAITADNALALGGDLDASDHTVVLRANQDHAGSQGFTQAAGTTIRTTHAASDAIQILVGGSGDAALATLVADSGGVQVQAGGMILSNGAATDSAGQAVNVTANALQLASGSGIELSTNVLTLEATVSAAGDLEIEQFGRELTVTHLALFAGDATLGSDAAVVLHSLSLPAHRLTLSAGAIRFEQPVAALHALHVTASGTVDFLAALTTTGSVVVDASGEVTFHGVIALGGGLDVSGHAVMLHQDVATDGAVQISAQNDLLVGVNIDAGAATITLLANQDQIGNEGLVQAAGTTIRTTSAANNAITIRAGGTGDVLLARVEASLGGVAVTAGGEIVDHGPPAASVLAKSLTATATAGIDLHTEIDSFSGTLSGPGMLRLVEADTLQLTSVNLAGGDASISADALSMGTIVTSGAVMLTARTGAITDGNGGLLNITAESLVISSVNGVDLDTRVGTLDLTLSGSGDVQVEQSNRSLTVTNLVVPDGDVSLLSNAVVTLQHFEIPAHQLTVAGSDVIFETAVQLLSDLTITATGDVVFQAAVDVVNALGIDADGDVTFQAVVVTGGALSLTGDQVWFIESLTTGGAIQISADDELRFSGDVDAGDQTISLRANQDGIGTQGLVLQGSLQTLNATANALVIDVQGSGSVLGDSMDVGGGVVIQAGGALRGFNQATIEIQAARVQAVTGTGIDLWTTATEVSAEVTRTGDILLTTADAVTAERLVTHAGSIELVSGNTMWLGIVTAGAGGDVTLTAQAGSILAVAGDPSASLVRADLLTLTTPGTAALRTDVDQLIATLSGSGSLAIDNQGALAVISASVHDGNAAISAASLEVGSITAPGSVALTTTGGGILGVGGATHVSTAELVLTSSGSVALTTDVDWLVATISQQGNLQISDIGQLQVNQVSVSHGAVDLNAAQDLLIAGDVIAEQGQISFASTHSDLRFVNSNLGTTLLVYSGGAEARIEGSADGDVIISGPGMVLFRTPVSQYFTVRPELIASAVDIPFFTDVQVSPLGWTTLIVSFGAPIGPEEFHFRLVIDWGDAVQTLTAAETLSGLTPLQRAGLGDAELSYVIRHQYASNPNTHDPTTPIPVSILASNSLSDGGPADVLFYAGGNRTDPLVTQVDLLLNVPASGLSIAFSPVIPPAAEVSTAEAEQPLVEPPASTVIAESTRSTQHLVTSTQTAAVYERYYVLRIVVQIDEEGNTRELADIRIDDDYLRNLPKLFELLPDDRYRLYQIREDGVAQLITDVIIRGGKSAGTLDLNEQPETLGEQSSTGDPAQRPVDLLEDSGEPLPVDLDRQSLLLKEPQGSQFRLITKAGVLQLRNW